jgi:hypothetical protein
MDILIALFTGTEVAVLFVGPEVALIAHAALLIGFVYYGATGRPDEARFASAVALLPLMRILSFVVPLPRADLAFSYGLTNLSILVAIILCMWRLRLRPSDVGLRVRINWLYQILIALSGPAIAVVTALGFKITWRNTGLPASPSLALIGALCFGAVVEEALYRGLMQRIAVQMLGAIGLGLMLVIYTVMSLGTPSIALILLNVVTGAWWIFCTSRTRGLWGAVVGHALFIAVLALAF